MYMSTNVIFREQKYCVILAQGGRWKESPFGHKALVGGCIWMLEELPPERRAGCPWQGWDYFAATCRCSAQEQGAYKKVALCGDVQVTVPFL